MTFMNTLAPIDRGVRKRLRLVAALGRRAVSGSGCARFGRRRVAGTAPGQR